MDSSNYKTYGPPHEFNAI